MLTTETEVDRQTDKTDNAKFRLAKICGSHTHNDGRSDECSA